MHNRRVQPRSEPSQERAGFSWLVALALVAAACSTSVDRHDAAEVPPDTRSEVTVTGDAPRLETTAPDTHPPLPDTTHANQRDPCAAATCGADSSCREGACVCDPGFVMQGSACVAENPGGPANRTKDQVCAKWQADYPTQSTTVYDEGTGLAACDPGTIDPVAHEDAMRRLNLYRWLVGVEPAGVDWDHQGYAQAAALMMHANDALNHAPPETWTCYSNEGLAGAASSNLTLGPTHPADTVDGYIYDTRSDQLGHRRWCINPSLDDTGFGHYGRGGVMWAFGQGSQAEPDYVAYPSPGPFPIDALHGAWSFHRRAAFTHPVVTITRIADDTPIAQTTTELGGTYGRLAGIRMDLSDAVSAGETYRVDVVDGAHGWSYETTLVDCGN